VASDAAEPGRGVRDGDAVRQDGRAKRGRHDDRKPVSGWCQPDCVAVVGQPLAIGVCAQGSPPQGAIRAPGYAKRRHLELPARQRLLGAQAGADNRAAVEGTDRGSGPYAGADRL
jgi:hypothetical protein